VECKKIDRTANAAYIHTDIYIYISTSLAYVLKLLYTLRTGQRRPVQPF